VLVRHGAVPDYQSAFDEYLAKGAKAYLSRRLYKPADAIALMRASGVVPVFAHPLTLNLELPELERFTRELIDAGIEGIEGYHGDWPEGDQAPLRRLGERNGLVVSGGSDYHGDMRPDRSLPGGKHGVIVPDEALAALRQVADELRPAAA
jgi:predicted metal-dependent phosphoesterase TrpH